MHKYLAYLKYAPHVLLVVLLLMAWHGWQNRHEYARNFITPAEPEEVIKLVTVQEKCVPVVHYIKEEAAKEDLVPEHIKKDDNKQVTAAIEVPAHRAKTLVTSIIDLSSGVSALSYRQRPVPFFGAGYKEAGIMYGLDERIIANGRWEPLRIGGGFLKIEGLLDYDPRDSSIEFFLGAGYLRRWR